MTYRALCLLFGSLATGSLIGQSHSLSLPSHPGAMVVNLEGFNITQMSAKPGGRELGIRAHDHGKMDALFFLFLTPEDTHQDAASCLQQDLKQIRIDMASNFKDVEFNPQSQDTPDSRTMLVSGSNGQYLYRYYGHEDQCFSIEMYADRGTALDLNAASSFLGRQKYDPAYIPTNADKFAYAGVLYETHQYKASAPVYADYLSSTPDNSNNRKLRRAATDNMGMALGITGDVEGARKVFEAAIKTDPDYPLYYYNLACADAEEGKAADAKVHLQQAFDRKANTLSGEHLPDPTQDDSIQKLKKNKEFWAFVQNLK